MRTIDADALKKALEVAPYNDIDDLTRTERLIDDAPTVDMAFDPQYKADLQGAYDCGKYSRPKGKWIDTGRTWEETVDGFIQYGKIYKCSACKAEAKGLGECTSFCGYCGTKMER